MNQASPDSDLAPGLLTTGATLQQFWALVEYARDTDKNHLSGSARKVEQQKTLRMVERLESALGWDLIEQKQQGQNGTGGGSADLLPIGTELVKVLTGFFDDLVNLESMAAKHGRTIRIASSTTLLHWLVLPKITEITWELNESAKGRGPELSFKQVERNEVAMGLTLRTFHFAVIRDAPDIDATRMTGSPQEVLKQLKTWAAAGDDQFAKLWSASSYACDNPHGHMRLAIELGHYGHRLCVRKSLWETIKQQSRQSGRKWNELLPVALCTNHQGFRDKLHRFEIDQGLHVTVRTDTWIESAQLATHGSFATVLPTLAFAAHPEFMSLDDLGFKFPDEAVVLMLNPSNLKSKAFRQALYAIASTVQSSLNAAGAAFH